MALDDRNVAYIDHTQHIEGLTPVSERVKRRKEQEKKRKEKEKEDKDSIEEQLLEEKDETIKQVDEGHVDFRA